jgi:two-component system, OmpR family, response regulator VicR
MPNTILLVEDDAMIASGLCYALEQEGYAATHCDTITAAKEAAENRAYDLALLDMQLPDGTGFDISGKLKAAGTSVIFLTVVDDEGNVVKAFEGGADDYVTKPFRLRELLARVKSALGRRSKQATDRLMLGSVTVDVSVGKAFINGSLLDLTALEYRLLLTFATNKGQILSRSQILENLWDSAGNFVEDNTLTVYIKRLREKLGDSASIETVRGMGYRAT